MNHMFTKQQIEAGLKLAQAWYEGWRIDDVEPEQLIEAIEKSEPPQGAENGNKHCNHV